MRDAVVVGILSYLQLDWGSSASGSGLGDESRGGALLLDGRGSGGSVSVEGNAGNGGGGGWDWHNGGGADDDTLG
jgi:hypothetical protein